MIGKPLYCYRYQLTQMINWSWLGMLCSVLRCDWISLSLWPESQRLQNVSVTSFPNYFLAKKEKYSLEFNCLHRAENAIFTYIYLLEIKIPPSLCSYSFDKLIFLVEAPTGIPCLWSTSVTTSFTSGWYESKSNTLRTTLAKPSSGKACKINYK